MQRILIMGNTGSGKSFLASVLARRLSLPLVSLDDLFWASEDFSQKRDPVEIVAMIEQKRAEDRWIMEGVYGDMITSCLADATCLLWLDLEVDMCIENLHARGERGNTTLLNWAQTYLSRKGTSSRRVHKDLFDTYEGKKVKLRSNDETARWLARL